MLILCNLVIDSIDDSISSGFNLEIFLAIPSKSSKADFLFYDL